MERFISSASSTSLISTVLTLTPQGSVCSSIIFCSIWLSFSRLVRSSSSSDCPSTFLRVELGEEFVKLGLSQHISQGGLGYLRSSPDVVKDFYHRRLRVDDAEIDDGIDADSNVIPGDDFLRRDIHGHDAQVHLHHAVDKRDNDEKPGTSGADETPQAEDNAALVFGHDFNGRGNNDKNYDNYDTH